METNVPYLAVTPPLTTSKEAFISTKSISYFLYNKAVKQTNSIIASFLPGHILNPPPNMRNESFFDSEPSINHLSGLNLSGFLIVLKI
ncbi:hypothetical protein RCL_jg13054.t1 [Rhizophagus clarus]|uniref:Uncharacterized protein n=1 Tax=Rhizophagus clarus TaxID=94130 RepID=A0A8H3KX39_9GLOM|nr:hypothetical protein RCL_jg13054.t1 [Rhizophagus clarus]